MKMIFSFLFALLFSLGNLTALAAEDSVVARFRASALRVLERAETRGIREIEGLQVAQIKAVAKSIPIVYSPLITMRQVGRRCAYWTPRMENVTEIPSGKKVTVPAHIRLNDDCKALPDSELEQLAAHEVLGAGFGIDRNYEVSLQLLVEPIAFASIVDQQLNKKWTEDFLLAAGGSVGVGGGGDSHDLRFKLEALSYLKALGVAELYGIPTEILALAVRKMSVAPAADLTRTLEFRAAGVEGPHAMSYVDSAIYRGSRPEDKEMREFFAIVLARQMVLYASDELGLTEGNGMSVLGTLQTKIVQKAELAIPRDASSLIHWSNPVIKAQYSENARKALSYIAIEKAVEVLLSQQFKSLIKYEASHLTLRLAR